MPGRAKLLLEDKQGFTLVEMFIVVAVVAVTAFIAVSVAGLTFTRNQLATESEHLMSTLRVAQTRSISGYQDDVWGVYATSTTHTLFRGSDYATRDTSYDEVYTLPDGVALSGLTEINFEIRTGETADTGTLTLTDDASGNTSTITINANGRVTDL